MALFLLKKSFPFAIPLLSLSYPSVIPLLSLSYSNGEIGVMKESAKGEG